MKILLTYSSRTGNTAQVAEAIGQALPADAECLKIEEAPEPDGYDLVVVGFWLNKGRANQEALAYLEKIRGRSVAFFFTLGAYPDSEHADRAAASTEKMLTDNGNTVLGHFRCHGRVDPETVERTKKRLPPDHPHAIMTPERRARLAEAAKHPDARDLEEARAFMTRILARPDKP